MGQTTTIVGRRGGVRTIAPPRRCPYCGRVLTAYCQTTWRRQRTIVGVRVQVQLKRLICRRPECADRARREGWL